MAEIKIEPRRPAIWAWVLGLLALLLIIWAAMELLGNDPEAASLDPMLSPAVDVAPTRLDPSPADTAAVGIPFAAILGSPAGWVGRTVSGEAAVPGVPTDRGFWIEDGGQRLFVVLDDGPAEVPINIQSGQKLRITGATVYDDVANVPGELDADTRRILQDQPVFLGVHERNVEVLPSAAS